MKYLILIGQLTLETDCVPLYGLNYGIRLISPLFNVYFGINCKQKNSVTES